jgi:hypothetical protein
LTVHLSKERPKLIRCWRRSEHPQLAIVSSISNRDITAEAHEWVQVYGVVGNSVKFLTAFVTYYSDEGGCPEMGCSTLSAKYTFDTHSSASFYPIILRVSGNKEGRPFRGNYRLVFDDKSLKYARPENIPDDIMPRQLK